jgi:hypothetical protein
MQRVRAALGKTRKAFTFPFKYLRNVSRNSGQRGRELFRAVEENKIVNVKRILTAGKIFFVYRDDDYNQLTLALHLNRDPEMVRAICDNIIKEVKNNEMTADVLLVILGAGTAREKNALLTAIEESPRNIDNILKLAEKVGGVDYKNKDDETSLYLACKKGSVNSVEVLITKGADVNSKNKHGVTPLLATAEINDSSESNEILKILLHNNADINEIDNDDSTALILAAKYDNAAHVEILCTNKALLDKKDKEGNTALLIASTEGYTDIVKELVENKADVEIVNENKDTALSIAVFNQYEKIVEHLIKAGANVNHENNDGHKIIVLALKKRNTSIIKLLLDNGADKEAGITYAKNDQELLNILEGRQEMYKGFSQGDFDKWQSLFETEKSIENISFCPLCLSYSERGYEEINGKRDYHCRWLQGHRCSQNTIYYHKRLYDIYYALNLKHGITWCTICNRIGAKHAHVKKGTHIDNDTPELEQTFHSFGGEAECIKEGGGGFDEKKQRLARLFTKICDLQKYVGKITKDEAIEQIVEYTWNVEDTSEDLMIEKDKNSKQKIVFPCTLPEKVNSNSIAQTVTRPKEEKGDEHPPKENKGTGESPPECATCLGTGTKESPVYQFQHHKQPNEEYINHTSWWHANCIKDAIEANGKTNKCLCQATDDCKGLMWPEELDGLKGFLNSKDKPYDNWPEAIYQKIFNEEYAKLKKKGGGSLSTDLRILQPMKDTLTCAVRGGGARKTRRGRKGRGRRQTKRR